MIFESLIFFVPYILVLVYIIYRSIGAAQPGDMNEFFLGRRKINRFSIAVSSVTSTSPTWLIFGASTIAYVYGLSALWALMGFILSDILLSLWIGPRFRKYTEDHHCLTLTDFFTSQFKNQNSNLRIYIAVPFLFFSICFITAQLLAGATMMYAFLQIVPFIGIAIISILALSFAYFPGHRKFSNTDLLQAVVILVVLIYVPIRALVLRDGIKNLHEEVTYQYPDFFSFSSLPALTLIGFLSIGLSSLGNPNYLVKIMSAETPRSFKRIPIIRIFTFIALASGAILSGLFAKAYFLKVDAIPGANAENVFIGLSSETVPVFFQGFIVAGVIAAAVSGAGSMILVSGSSAAVDIYKKTIRKSQSFQQSQMLFISKIAMVGLVYIAVAVALLFRLNFLKLLLFSMAGFGAAIAPVLILTLFWSGITSAGMKAGVITGSGIVFLWTALPILSDKLYGLMPGFVLSFIAVWVVSMADKALLRKKFNRIASFEEIKKGPFQN